MSDTPEKPSSNSKVTRNPVREVNAPTQGKVSPTQTPVPTGTQVKVSPTRTPAPTGTQVKASPATGSGPTGTQVKPSPRVGPQGTQLKPSPVRSVPETKPGTKDLPKVVPQPMTDPDAATGTRTFASPTTRDAGTVTRVSRSGIASPKTLELGRGFLSALFMGLRTAQIHDPQNQAFERAVNGVRLSADQLYAATGGFSISFVDESAFLNGVRLRFEGGMFDSMRTLRHILESKDLGGIEMRAPPSHDAIRKLLLLFCSAEAKEEVNKDDLLAAQIGVLGVQRFADQSRDGAKVDRRVFALQSYAKLLLAFREQKQKMEQGAHGQHAPRLRAVRVIQDLVELCGDRPDFLLRLGSNHSGAPVDELHAVNVAVLSIAVGHALGMQRPDLVDVGVAALFHDIGRTVGREPPPPSDPPAASADGPIAYDGELKLAESWDDAPAGGLDLNQQESLPPEDEPEPLPIESIVPVEQNSDILPLDPSEAPPAALEPPEDTSESYFSPIEHAGEEFGATTQADVELSNLELEEILSAKSDDESDKTPANPEVLELLDQDEDEAALVIPVEGADGVEPRDTDSLDRPTPLDASALIPADDEPLPPPLEPRPPACEAPGSPGHVEEAIATPLHPHTALSLSRLLTGGGISRSSLTRAIVASEHHVLAGERYDWGDARPRAHLFGRVVAVVDAYDALACGLGSEDGAPMHPLDALRTLIVDRSGRFDQRLVDVLMNVLRAFPVGTEVVLDSGERAMVASHAGGTRWDRPVVKTLTDPPKSVDLMLRDEGRFRVRILGTSRAIGQS
jgi:hypothetical protein